MGIKNLHFYHYTLSALVSKYVARILYVAGVDPSIKVRDIDGDTKFLNEISPNFSLEI